MYIEYVQLTHRLVFALIHRHEEPSLLAQLLDHAVLHFAPNRRCSSREMVIHTLQGSARMVSCVGGG